MGGATRTSGGGNRHGARVACLFEDLAAKLISCRHSVLKLLLARNCHSYCCRRYELRSSLPELGTRPQFRNADLHKKSAFTLAEVLITLGIIGVVAALTIPSIVAHYKKQEVTTKLKTVESLFTQMLNFSIAENGDPQNWDLGASYGVDAGSGNAEKTLIRITEKYFLPYLKTSNYYGYVSLKDAGYPVYYKVDGSLQKWNLESSDAKYCIIELANGMTTFLRMNYSNEYTMLNLIIYVDINGKKAPNIWGRDTFEADIDVRKGKFYWSGSGYGRERLKNFCADKYAYVCGALIWLDGYEIKPDYPIKI